MPAPADPAKRCDSAGAPDAPPPSPVVRCGLGADLRRLRQARSLRLADVAAHLDITASTLCRIETGQAPTRVGYLTAMLDLYGIHDPAQRDLMTRMAREGQKPRWSAEHHDVLPASTAAYLDLETAATQVRSYSAQTVPDLLQTPDYAAAACQATRPDLNPSQIADLIALQHSRQHQQRRSRHQLHLIMDETALVQPIAPAHVMAGQLQHLLAAAAIPDLVIQTTTSRPTPDVLSPSFTLLTFPGTGQPAIACYYGPAGHITTTRRAADVRAMRHTFRVLVQAALSPGDTTALIREHHRRLIVACRAARPAG